MYDPTVGRWLSEDPEGFAAGDGNLYRYVGNAPTNAVDPSGLQQQGFVGPPAPAAYGTREFWLDRPQAVLNITGSIDAAYVRNAINSLGTSFSLAQIPFLRPGGQLPAFNQIGYDRAGVSGSPGFIGGASVATRAPLVTASQLARINIRVNLVNLKQDLVNKLYDMVVNNWPAGRPLDRTALANAANSTADDLIRMVDRFLANYTGARPAQGSRNPWFATRQSAPWCADWAEAMDAWIGRQIRSNRNHPANNFFDLRWGQCNNNTTYRGESQHNFIIIYPVTYAPRMSTPGNAFVDPVLLVFDPWRELMPRLYAPIPLTRANGAPTEIFNCNRLEEQYFRTQDP